MVTIDQFREKVITLKSGDFMSLNGAGSGIIGSSNAGGDGVAQLQRSAIEFARVYKDTTSDDELQAARKELTGKIMVAVTLDAISEQRADELMGMLGQLMKERKDQWH